MWSNNFLISFFYCAFARWTQGDLLIDRSYYMGTMLEENIVIGGIILVAVFIGVIGK
ncbi:hypothetical protein [Commensalibacter communis]|uniref:hypothetical protein n=1 Tax=Commensalibacter communis TaxID=2972786 RepID=UPI00233108AA|nr:hypothetical protein [Commensalibacter communis]